MILLSLDVVLSMTQLRERGLVGDARIETRIDRARATLIAADERIVQLGLDEGDGLLLMGEPSATIDLLRRAIEFQEDSAPHFRIVMGVGHLRWSGQTATSPALPPPGTSVRGAVLGIIARLKSVCPPGAVAFEETLHGFLKDYPEILDRAEFREEILRGWGREVCWIIDPRAAERRQGGTVAVDSEGHQYILERITRLEERVKVQEAAMQEAVEDLAYARRHLDMIDGARLAQVLLTILISLVTSVVVVALVRWLQKGG